MKNADWKDTAELIGIAAIVASLIFVGLQMKQSHDIAMAEYGQNQYANYNELDFAIANHADILVKSNSGAGISETERAILAALVTSFWRATIVDTWERGRLTDGDSTSMIDGFAIFLFRNPGARKVWLEDSLIYEQMSDHLDSINVAPIRSHVLEALDSLERKFGTD